MSLGGLVDLNSALKDIERQQTTSHITDYAPFISPIKKTPARGVMIIHDVIHVKLAVQIKRWKEDNNVQAPEIQKLRGVLNQGERGVFITASCFRGSLPFFFTFSY